jgi:hypothetical protein
MRKILAMSLLSGLLACAHAAPRRVAVSDDGKAAIVGGQSWRAPEGVTFFERKDAVHVVSLVPGSSFDVAIPFGADGRPVVPVNAPFDIRDGVVVLRDRTLPPTARLVESGQLYTHDDHFHLTHRWENADWRALYRAREEDSDLPAGTKQVAAFALATLLDHRIPGKTEEATARGMQRMTDIVARARRAVEGKYPAKQIMAMVVHDFEIQDGGTLSIEGKTFNAADGLKFNYCGDHFHVEDAGGRWAHPIHLDAVEPGQFDMPPSMFFDVNGSAVALRAGAAPWKELLAAGQIKLNGDRWNVSERYAGAGFVRLAKASLDEKVPPHLREAARRSVIELMKLPLDIESDAAFSARLAALDLAAEARWSEIEAQLPKRR